MPRSTLVEHPQHPPNLMYDNPSSSFQVEDFFNLDLLTGPADDDASLSASASSSSSPNATNGVTLNTNSASTSSRASSEARTDSPAASFAHLQTPPETNALPSFDMNLLSSNSATNFDMSVFGGLAPIEEESMFTLGGGNEFFKPGMDSLAHAPFDLFGSFDSGLGSATSSDLSTSAPASSSNSASTTSNTNNSSYPFAIDPQLVRTPAPSTTTDSHSEAGGADPDSDDDEAKGLVVAPVKVGGKGKARRGTLTSGGVSKKAALPGPQSIFGALAAAEASSGALGKGGKVSNAVKLSNKEKGWKDKDQDDEDGNDDGDDWRPTPEEYAKMSSKEKRQLRNKISARNFRIRRKEYIHTLEGDIADRDRLIDAIRNELGSTKSENNALRQEVEALKKAILEGRASPMLPPPAPLSPLSPLSSFASIPASASSSSHNSNNSNASGTTNNIIKPNTHKDLPMSPRLGASPFWGGQSGFGGFGGITPVHTAIIPETAASVFGGANGNSSVDRQKENINPAMNHPQQQQQQVWSQVLSQLHGDKTNAAGISPFDNFADVNPFTLKTLDAYRMQLWNRVAVQTQQAQRARMAQNSAGYPSPHTSPAHSPKSNASPNPGLSGLASSLRPQYFASSTSPATPTAGTGKAPFGALFSGKGLPYAPNGHSSGLPSPPPSPRTSEKDRAQQQAQTRRAREQREQAQAHAFLAALASQTVLQKMGQAFWDAFSGSGSSSSSSSAPSSSTAAAGTSVRAWDAEKVRRVLEGTAELRVVDVEHKPSSPSASNSTSADVLTERMRSLALVGAKQENKGEGDKGEKKSIFTRMSCGGRSRQ